MGTSSTSQIIRAVPPAQRLDRAQRVIAEVLVVDGVEFERGDEIADIGRLDDGNAVGLEHLFEATDEPIGIGNVGEDVVGVDHVGELAFRREPPGKLLVEELDKRRDALGGDRELGDVGRRLDAENGDASLLVELQQISVVARHLDDQARRAQPSTADERPDQLARMLDHGVGERGGIGVVAEQPFGRHSLADLDQRAVRTEIKLERKAVLRLMQLLRGEQRIGKRHAAEVEHRHEAGVAAGPTRRSVLGPRSLCVHGAHHRFQGGVPDSHSRSSPCLSRSVSMHCQNPSCL